MESRGLTKDQIERARETEDVLQFIMRGVISDPAFTGDYDVYLYDKHQADALAEYIKDNQIGDVELIPVVEAGIMEVERESRRQFVEEDQRSMKQRDEKRRVKNTAPTRQARPRKKQKIGAGLYRGRGRPRKAADIP